MARWQRATSGRCISFWAVRLAQLRQHVPVPAARLYVLPVDQAQQFEVAEKFNQLGELTDQSSRELVEQMMTNLAAWTDLLRG